MSQIILNNTIQGHTEEGSRTTMRQDKPDLGLLNLHRDRLAAAAEALGWRNLPCLEHTNGSPRLLQESLEHYENSLPPPPADRQERRKLRILIGRDGSISIDSIVINLSTSISRILPLEHPFMPLSLDEPAPVNARKPCEVYVDHQPTRPSMFTTHKTTHRCVYNAARSRANLEPTTIPTATEVLLYNSNNEIIETSLCTIYFRREGTWITPAAICGPNLGVTRRLAMENGLCKQGTIELRDLKRNETVWLSNAVRGFFRGVLKVDEKGSSEMTESKETTLNRLGAGMSSGSGVGGS
ncbi:Aminodeoxychorismate lyase [Neophaeococcomyces mojaviensis]|uniref:Aminodeoxychorismate lyase n=1 Tax=Neophaeococcomyces mojaviensis TaxID=3383035 RepID=A0ACC3AIV6_9EURO|nr:Aminodeoxychorismate lyase [Knufia sp. JES_112]